MIKVSGISLLVLGMFTSFASSGYECKPNSIEATTRVENFLNNKDGTVTDLRFGLVWQICTFGQQYSVENDNCIGDPTPINTWSDAVHSQDEFNSQNPQQFDDWRLPNIKELQSIVERQCRQPAIRTDIFKGTANGVYWSNTPDNTVNGLGGRIVDFSDGVEFFRATEPAKFVRHVRAINN